MSDTVYILSNIGTPSAPTTAAVRPYLNEFLTDPGVIPLPWLIRQFLVRVLIVPRRAPESAEKYALIWTPEGSPLMVNSLALQKNLSEALKSPVLLGMLYNKPNMETAFREAKRLGAKKIVIVPLYPQFAEATTGGTVLKARQVSAKVAPEIPLEVFPQFPTDPFFVKPAARLAKEMLASDEFVLFTFHGLPESLVKKGTPECLREAGCCERPESLNKNCYRAQSFRTAAAMATEMGLKPGKWSVSFQSRLGRAKWITPYTEDRLRELPKAGHKKILVVSPSFVSDCLETLEELGHQGRHTFMEAGGESYRLAPCVNGAADFAEGFAAALRAYQ